MRKPFRRADQEIIDALVDVREERIARLARMTKKARSYIARFVRF